MTVPDCGPEQPLTPTSSDTWMESDGWSQVDFQVAHNPLFSYRVRLFMHPAPAGGDDTVAGLTAIMTVRSNNPDPVTAPLLENAVYRCYLRLDAFSSSGEMHAMVASCLVTHPMPGMASDVALPFAKHFARGHTLNISCAVVKFEPNQGAAPERPALPPHLLASLNDTDFCDCAILPTDSPHPIHVSRAIIATASPYFHTMFRGPWADAVKSELPIEFGWNSAALLPCLMHMYSGWVLGEPLPNVDVVGELCAKYKVDVEGFLVYQLHELMDLAGLLELMDLAGLLELPAMVKAANRQMVKVLNGQFGQLE